MNLKASKKVGTLMLTSLLCGMLFSSYSAIAYDRSEHSSRMESSIKHERGNHMPRHFKKMVKYLKLSEEQQEQMKSIRENASENRAQFKQSMQGFHDEIEALMGTVEFDEQGFNALYAQYQGEFQEMAMQKAKSKHAILQILNKEQQEKFLNFKRKSPRYK